MVNLRCYLFGHTGNFYAEQYHVCDRCGLHAYYDAEEYERGAVFHCLKHRLGMKWFWWRQRHPGIARWMEKDDDFPF